MLKKMSILMLVLALSSALMLSGLAQAQGQGSSGDLFRIINNLDTSAASLRRGDSDSAKNYIGLAFQDYIANFSSSVAEVNSSLDEQIKNKFAAVYQTPVESEIISLRADVSKATSLVGVYLSPLFEYSIFVILGISLAVSFFVTLITKKMVNWELVKQNKEKIAAFQKEYREAMKKRDMKLVHKLQLQQPEINKLMMQNTSQTMKPSIIYMIPLFVLWVALNHFFKGWVVAWLPFVRIDLPFIGPLVVFGVGWWYFITYLGFSQIFRKVVIGD
ncbi:MAG: EMC3/TMCO1 family protein [Candidatus Hadarchaeum sp.]|uniref:EMC3/TMCO1 family protein n=1 Tax=Candidatus Hadarchaeum sp. TaxID=2883567 RepID=UPI003D099BD0